MPPSPLTSLRTRCLTVPRLTVPRLTGPRLTVLLGASTALAATVTVAAAATIAGPLPAPRQPVWPVEPAAVIAPFEPPSTPWGPGHRGIDLAARTGQVVRAIQGGIIGFSGVIAGKPVVTVLLADGRRVTYEPVASTRSAGERVETGAVIGTIASAGGHCGGLAGCLHVGLIREGEYLDPLLLLRQPAVLKPLHP